MSANKHSPKEALAVANPYGLRQRSHGFYVLVSEFDGSRTATHWTASEDRAREHVSRRGHYGVRFAHALNIQLAGVRA